MYIHLFIGQRLGGRDVGIRLGVIFSVSSVLTFIWIVNKNRTNASICLHSWVCGFFSYCQRILNAEMYANVNCRKIKFRRAGQNFKKSICRNWTFFEAHKWVSLMRSPPTILIPHIDICLFLYRFSPFFTAHCAFPNFVTHCDQISRNCNPQARWRIFLPRCRVIDICGIFIRRIPVVPQNSTEMPLQFRRSIAFVGHLRGDLNGLMGLFTCTAIWWDNKVTMIATWEANKDKLQHVGLLSHLKLVNSVIKITG